MTTASANSRLTQLRSFRSPENVVSRRNIILAEKTMFAFIRNCAKRRHVMQHFRNPRTIQNMKIFFIAIFLSFGINLSNAQNINAPGNLESPKPLSCIKLSEVTNENNPADILNGMRKCIDQKDYKNAPRLFAIAGVYGKYDSFRVKDKTAHQALLVLQQSIFSTSMKMIKIP